MILLYVIIYAFITQTYTWSLFVPHEEVNNSKHGASCESSKQTKALSTQGILFVHKIRGTLWQYTFIHGSIRGIKPKLIRVHTYPIMNKGILVQCPTNIMYK